ALLAFWQSQPGRRILRQAKQVHREIPFRARLSKQDLTQLNVRVNPDLPEDEFFVGRGMVDLAVILPAEIWLLDFKTDQVTASSLPERVRLYTPQLKLYGLALSRIYCRPVTEHWLHFLSLGRTV